MDINELKEMKVIIEKMLEEEHRLDNSPNYISFLEKKLKIVGKMEEIYTNPDIDYKISGLERIYIEIVVGIPEEKLSSLSELEYAQVFNDTFPRNWYSIAPQTKEIILSSAILDQNVISKDYIECDDKNLRM